MINRPVYQISSHATDHNYMDVTGKKILLFVYVLNCIVGRLDVPGIETRWWRDFLQPFRPALGLASLLYDWYRVFPGDKAAGAWR